MDDKKLSDAVNRSGFPLQIALQREVERTCSDHEWKVMFWEHSWLNPRNDSYVFIDLILENGTWDTVMVVECKRVVDCSWIFLIDDTKQMKRRHAKGWLSEYVNGSFSRFGFDELQVSPMTPESQYCVVDGQTPKERPMLERIASILVSSTEGFANEEMPRMQNKNGMLRVYFSVIVTTAKLKVCAFDPELISLATGEIANAEYTEVPFLRFRKQLGSHHEIPDIREIPKFQLSARYREIAKAKESTVFIVNSECFSDFLRRFEVVAA